MTEGLRIGGTCEECGTLVWTFASGTAFNHKQIPAEIHQAHSVGNPFRCPDCGADLDKEPKVIPDKRKAVPALPPRP